MGSMENSAEKQPVLRIGAKVWLWLCIVVNAGLFAVMIFLFDLSDAPALTYVWYAFSVLIIAGYALLLTGRRVGFVVVAACAALNIVGAIFLGVFSFQTIASAVINLLITLLVVGRSWSRMIPLGRSPLTVSVAAVLAVLTVLTVIMGIGSPSARYDYDGRLEIRDESGVVVLAHEDFVSARAVKNEGYGPHEYMVQLEFTDGGRAKFKLASARYVGKKLHFYVGDALILSPEVAGEIDSDKINVVGAAKDEARSLVKNLNRNLKKYR